MRDDSRVSQQAVAHALDAELRRAADQDDLVPMTREDLFLLCATLLASGVLTYLLFEMALSASRFA